MGTDRDRGGLESHLPLRAVEFHPPPTRRIETLRRRGTGAPHSDLPPTTTFSTAPAGGYGGMLGPIAQSLGIRPALHPALPRCSALKWRRDERAVCARHQED